MNAAGAEPLLGRTAIERLADAGVEAGLAEAGIDAVEVLVTREAGGLTRFANSQIHQNVWRETLSASVRVVTTDARVGVVGVDTDDPAAVAGAARSAAAAARFSPPDPEFPGLAPAAEAGEVRVDDATLGATPGDRAAAVRAVLAETGESLEAAGMFSTGATEVGLVTSTGQRLYSPLSETSIVIVATGPTSSGYADGGGRALADVDTAAIGRRAADKARSGADPEDAAAGLWPVILEPAAVADLVAFFAYLGFGGRDYVEGRSFAAGRLGEKVVDEAITIVDDARSPDTLGLPFDHEGTPKQRVTLLDRGVLSAVVHDRHSARQAGATSTGHGLPAPNAWGPVAANPILEPGDGGSIDDLVAGCERGLLVTRFHYTNVVHPKETVLTGMTRDGTFLVRDGRVVGPVRNLRFTQSVLDALATVEAVSSERRWCVETFFGGSTFPALRLPSFAFTSTTSFG